jgi:hypothetical protein
MQEEINWNDPKHLRVEGISLVPTVVQCFTTKKVLGLVYSSEESLRMAQEKQLGIYYSRSRKGIWIKSPSGKTNQKLLRVSLDCDSDALIFEVEQRGEGFCHLGTPSCFVTVKDFSRPLIIGYCTGHSEKITFRFLEKLGIFLSQKINSRNFRERLTVKTHLHPYLQLVAIKPKDIKTLGHTVDVLIAYDNLDIPSCIFRHKWTFSQPIHPVKVVLVASCFQNKNEIGKVATEYPHLKEYPNMFSVNGGAEDYLVRGLCDAAVVVCDSGETLKANGLEIVETIMDYSDLCVYFGDDIYKQEPRFFRELRNGLEKEETIYFYSVDGPFGFMSNFYPCEFVARGQLWKSSEHFYQAYKFIDHFEIFERVRNAKTCKECYKLAWKFEAFFRKDWKEVKDDIMWEALQNKFQQNPDLFQKLKNTGTCNLVEHALKDFHYGCGIDGSGKNILGKMLMVLRSKEVLPLLSKL